MQSMGGRRRACWVARCAMLQVAVTSRFLPPLWPDTRLLGLADARGPCYGIVLSGKIQ